MESKGRTTIQACHDEAALARSIPGCKTVQTEFKASARFQKAWPRSSGARVVILLLIVFSMVL